MKDRRIEIQHELEWYKRDDSKQNRPLSQAHIYAHQRVRSRIRDTLQNLGCSSHARVLDLGVGMGNEVSYIKEVTDNIIGVDISFQALEACRRSYDIRCIVADIVQPPFPSGFFDFIVICGVLHHLVGQGGGDIEYFITNIRHLVTDRGWIVAIEPNLFFPNGPVMALVQRLYPGMSGMFGLVPHETPLSPLFLESVFHSARLCNVKIEAASFVYNRFPLWLSKLIVNNEDRIRNTWLLKHFGWWTIVYGQRIATCPPPYNTE